MYDRDKKNINKLLENIEVPGIRAWYVTDLRDMEWKSHVRLTLNVVIQSEYFRNVFVREWNTHFDTTNFEYGIKQKLIGLVKHYAYSFLGINIGDIKVVNLISYEMVNPTSYYVHSDYTSRYTTYDEYEWFA
jgi:hypothetical protein